MMINNYDDVERTRRLVEEGRHRELVGGLWDEIGRLSLDFLVAHGLRPDAYFLDVGCGCLRVGIPLIDYLEPGHYFGVDSSPELLSAGYEIELPRYGLQEKLPRENLLCSEEFEFDRLPQAPLFDMVLAQSLFTHLPLNHIRLCLLRLAPVTRPGAVFYATVFHCRDRPWAGPHTHEPGGITSYPTRDPYHYRSDHLRSVAAGLPWSVANPRKWDHPRDQAIVAFEKQPVKPVAVLGMHRSGTSCLAGCLAEAGLALGDVNHEAPHNRRGNQENRRIMDLHEDVLRESGGSWLEPPLDVVWTDEHRKRLDALLAEYGSHAVWGFKDPRTLLTLDVWRAKVPGIRAVGTFRHPAAVAASLEERDGLPFEKGLQLWADYNRRLLRYRDELGCELVSFDLPASGYSARVGAIALRLGLNPPDGGFQFFDEELRHNAPDSATLPSDVAEIYQRLLEASDSGHGVELADRARQTPELSVVVVVHDMAREAPRTLHSLSPGYQQQIDASDYEVIVVDNGSSEPLGEDVVSSFGPGLRYIYVENASPSPAGAVNLGVRRAQGEHVGILVDGARIVTPGMLASALQCLRGFPRAVVGSVGFHLGPDVQIRAMQHGYDQAREDALLESVGWPDDGYRLFEIAALAASNEHGWFGPMNESNCVFLARSLFDELHGFDESFDAPGGGFVNLDFWGRACELPETTLFTLAGEASFHQFHGGAATSIPEDELDEKLLEWHGQFARIRGHDFQPPDRRPRLFGEVPRQALPCFQTSAARANASAGDANEELRALEARLAGVLASRSWRLTAPLRRLAKLLRRNP